jgi:hypothetical protein
MTLSRGGTVLPKKSWLLAEAEQPAVIRLTPRISVIAKRDWVPVIN